MRVKVLVLLVVFLGVSMPLFAFPLSGGFIDDRSPQLSYLGSWSFSSDVSAYAGTVSVGNASSIVEFQVYGSMVVIYGTKSPDGSADVAVYLDAVLLDSVSFYDPSTLYIQEVVTIADLSNEVHTVTLVGVAASDFHIDSVYVMPFQVQSVVETIFTSTYKDYVFAALIIASISASFGMPVQAVLYFFAVVFGVSRDYYPMMTMIYIVILILTQSIREAGK